MAYVYEDTESLSKKNGLHKERTYRYCVLEYFMDGTNELVNRTQ